MATFASGWIMRSYNTEHPESGFTGVLHHIDGCANRGNIVMQRASGQEIANATDTCDTCEQTLQGQGIVDSRNR